MYKFLNEKPNLSKIHSDITNMAKPYERFSQATVRDLLFFYAAVEKDFSKVKYQLTEYEKDNEYFSEFTNNFLNVPPLTVINIVEKYNNIPVNTISETAKHHRLDYSMTTIGIMSYLFKDSILLSSLPADSMTIVNLLEDTNLISEISTHIRYEGFYVDAVKDVLHMKGFVFHSVDESYTIFNKVELVDLLINNLKRYLGNNPSFNLTTSKLHLPKIRYMEKITDVPF